MSAFYTPTEMPDAEFRQRRHTVQQGLAAADIDILLLTSDTEFRYLTGFATRFWQSPTRPWFLLLPASGEPIAVIPSIGVECMRRTGIADIRSWASPASDGDEGIALLAAALRQSVGPRARIGLMAGPECVLRLPHRDLLRLQSLLPGCTFEDGSAVLQRARQVKTAAEIARIGAVCDIVSGVFEALPGQLAAGQTVREVFRRFKIDCLAAGVDDIDYLVGGAGADGYRDIISPPSDHRLAAGDILMLDTGCVLDGYHCDFDRNYAIGDPSPHVVAAYQRLWDATEAALQAVRPGMTASALFRVMHDVITSGKSGASGASAAPAHNAAEASGVDAVGRYGHGLGLQLTETPSLAPHDHTVLEAGMVLTLEPSMPLPGGRLLVHEENIVLTEDGARLLTRRAPATLPVCG